MKLAGLMTTAVLSLTLGAVAPAYAQQEQQEKQEEQKAKPAQDERKGQPEKSAKQEEKPSAAQPAKNNRQDEKNAQQQDKNTKQEEKNAQQQGKNTRQEEKTAQQQHTQEAKPAVQAQHSNDNHGGRIPDDRFKANFGREHSFRVSQGDYRDRHFQYGGYSFGFVDPWPSNWLYTQDVYVIEIDGVYYLCNPMYPGVNLVLSFTL